MKLERLWLARLLVGAVTAWNLQAALAFLLRPESYAVSFELSGVPGAAAVRGVGVLFLMWVVPYCLALWHPRKHRSALMIAVTMQLIGLVGESAILVSLPAGHGLLRSSIERFIGFDAAGLLALVTALYLVRE